MANDSQRAHERVAFDTSVRVSSPTTMDAKGLDLGAGGMALHAPHAVAEGSAVAVDLFGDGKSVAGTVRKATPRAEGGFRLGIQFHEENGHLVARWSSMQK